MTHPFLAATMVCRLRRVARPASAGLLALAFAATATLAQGLSAAPVMAPLDRLMEPGPLPDIVQGSPSAPVTIIEYASLTCSHCAAFHEETWPGLKARYVDTGKVRFILREFPLDPLAAAAFMLAVALDPTGATHWSTSCSRSRRPGPLSPSRSNLCARLSNWRECRRQTFKLASKIANSTIE
jgi:protein-disulfide isomerase